MSSKLHGTLGALALVVGGGMGTAHAALPVDVHYAEAVRLFQSGRWPEAYGRFCAAGSAGDGDGARICLFMHQYGPVLYGSHWDASQDDLDQWKFVAARKPGRPQAEFKPAGPSSPGRVRPAEHARGAAKKGPIRVAHQGVGG